MVSTKKCIDYAEISLEKIAIDNKDGAGVVTSQESAWDRQVGGDHYTKLKIQPMHYSMENNLDPCQHTAIKYITRFKDKDGRKDLQKARDCIDMLEEYYYGSETG